MKRLKDHTSLFRSLEVSKHFNNKLTACGPDIDDLVLCVIAAASKAAFDGCHDRVSSMMRL